MEEDNSGELVAKTRNPLYKFKMTWIIENFLLLVPSPDVNEGEDYIESTFFSTANDASGLYFTIKIHPRRIKKDSTDYVGVYLKFFSRRGNVEPFSVSECTFWIEGSDGQILNEKTFSEPDGEKSEIGIGLDDFIDRKQLGKKGYLSDGSLTIRCFAQATIRLVIFPLVRDLVHDVPSTDMDFSKYVLEKLHSDGLFSDVTLKTGNKEFKCHKSILAARCPFFDVMFKSDLNEARDNVVDLTESMNEKELADLVRYIYTRKTEHLTDTCYKLHEITKIYEIPGLDYRCQEELLKKVDQDTAFDLLVFAEKHGVKKLKKAAAYCIWNIIR